MILLGFYERKVAEIVLYQDEVVEAGGGHSEMREVSRCSCGSCLWQCGVLYDGDERVISQ